MRIAEDAVQFDLWPLAWWQKPWIVGMVLGIGLVACSMIFIAIRRLLYRRRKALPLHETILLRLYRLRSLPLESFQERSAVYIELLVMMRDYAYHLFGIMHEGMTDVEFLQELERSQIRDSAERFVELVELLSDEVSLAKFAAKPLSRALVEEHILELVSYFQEIEHHERSKYKARDKNQVIDPRGA